MTNNRSIFEQPAASTSLPLPLPLPLPPASGPLPSSSPPLFRVDDGPHAHANAATQIATDRALIIAAHHRPEKLGVELPSWSDLRFTRCAAVQRTWSPLHAA